MSKRFLVGRLPIFIGNSSRSVMIKNRKISMKKFGVFINRVRVRKVK